MAWRPAARSRCPPRGLLENGAVLDVAGAVGVKLAMESNNVKVNIQGNEQRDAPVSQDGKTLNNTDVWVDRRTLIQIAKGRQRLRAGALVYAGRPAGSGRLSGHHRAWHRRMGVGGWHRHRGGRRAGESRRLPRSTSPAARWTCRAAISGKAGCAARTAGCTKYRERREICCTRACTRASRMSMRVGATRARAISQPADRAASARKGYTAGRDAGQLVVSTKTAVLDGDIIGEAFQASIKRRPDRTSTPACASKRATGNRSGPVVGRPAGHRRIPGQELRTERQGALGLRSVCHDGSISIQDGQPSGAPAVNLDDPCRRLETAAFPWTPAG